MEITEEVFIRWHGKACGNAQLATNRPLCQRKTDGGLEKSPCKSVEQEENHKKSPKRSTLVVG